MVKFSILWKTRIQLKQQQNCQENNSYSKVQEGKAEIEFYSGRHIIPHYMSLCFN